MWAIVPGRHSRIRDLQAPLASPWRNASLGFAMCLLALALIANPLAAQPPPLPGINHGSFSASTQGIGLESPQPERGLQVLPINLPTALLLSSSQPIDVQLAAERVRGAMAQLGQA